MGKKALQPVGKVATEFLSELESGSESESKGITPVEKLLNGYRKNPWSFKNDNPTFKISTDDDPNVIIHNPRHNTNEYVSQSHAYRKQASNTCRKRKPGGVAPVKTRAVAPYKPKPVAPAKQGYTPIAKDFSRSLTQHKWINAGSIRTVHLLYVRAVQKNKTKYTRRELSKILCGDNNVTSTYKKRAVSDLKDLKKENLDFLKIKKIDDEFQVFFEQRLLESAGNPGEFQLFENDFLKDYEKIFKQKRERLTKTEIGGALFLAHYILINKNHASYQDGKGHRIFFRNIVDSGCFSKRSLQRKDYTDMRETVKQRFMMLQEIGFIHGVFFSKDLKIGSGGSGQIYWTNKPTGS